MSEIEQPLSESQPDPQAFTRLDIGMSTVLLAMAIAGVVGLIAVLDADNDLTALGVGFGVVWSIVVTGGRSQRCWSCSLHCGSRRAALSERPRAKRLDVGWRCVRGGHAPSSGVGSIGVQA